MKSKNTLVLLSFSANPLSGQKLIITVDYRPGYIAPNLYSNCSANYARSNLGVIFVLSISIDD